MDQSNPPLGEMHTIAKGYAKDGPTCSRRKVYAMWLSYKEVYNVERLVKQPRVQVSSTISFGDEDCQGVVYIQRCIGGNNVGGELHHEENND